MRLSEAIRLGSLTIEKPALCDIDACAITMALNAVGNKALALRRYFALETEWPWIGGVNELLCPWCKDGYTVGLPFPTSILYHPFDSHVMTGQITIEQLADWIRTIEPPEPVDKLREEADEILAAYLPKDWTKQRWIRAMASDRTGRGGAVPVARS